MPGYYRFHLYQPPCSGGRLQNDGVSSGDHLPTIYVGWKIISGGFMNDNKHIWRASSQNLLHRIWLHCVQTWKGIMTIAKKSMAKAFYLINELILSWNYFPDLTQGYKIIEGFVMHMIIWVIRKMKPVFHGAYINATLTRCVTNTDPKTINVVSIYQ